MYLIGRRETFTLIFSAFSFAVACLFRYNLLSFIYLIYLLLIPLFAEPTKTTMQGHTGRLLKSLCFTSLTFLLLHIIYQITINSLLAGDNIEPDFNSREPSGTWTGPGAGDLRSTPLTWVLLPLTQGDCRTRAPQHCWAWTQLALLATGTRRWPHSPGSSKPQHLCTRWESAHNEEKKVPKPSRTAFKCRIWA
ncbi:hypothetical protein AOLI_G00053050 [Acnodon oligacanthus]